MLSELKPDRLLCAVFSERHASAAWPNRYLIDWRKNMRHEEQRPDLPSHLIPTIVTCVFILILGFLLCCLMNVDRRGAAPSDSTPNHETIVGEYASMKERRPYLRT